MKESISARLVPTLDASTFSSKVRYRLEMDAIFRRSWLYAAHESQLPSPGSFLTIEIDSCPILLIRGNDHQVRAFHNVCVHRGHVLVAGTGCASQFVCPYHSWAYGCDGTLKRAPGIPIEAVPASNRALKPVRLECWHGFVFIRLLDDGPSLNVQFAAAFADLESHATYLDRLRYVRRFVHDVDGNWKVLVDNYLECYHCPPNHPSFVDLMRVTDYAIETHENYSTHRAPAGRGDNTAYHFDGAPGARRAFDGWWLWPNLTFNIFPGTPNLLVFHMLPLTSDTSVGYCDYFFIDGEVEPQAEALMTWETHVLSEEDNERVASVHKGMRSMALSNGVLVVDPTRGDISEHAIEHFQRLVTRAVGQQ